MAQGRKSICFGLNRSNSPCNGCTREIKCPGCHDRCVDYKKWKAEGDNNREAKRQYDIRRGF